MVIGFAIIVYNHQICGCEPRSWKGA